MTMDIPLIELGPKEISSGLMPGLNKLAVPVWETAENIDFDLFGAHTSKGREVAQYQSILFDDAPGNFDSAAGTFDEYAARVPAYLGTNKEVVGIIPILRSNKSRLIFAGTRDKLYTFNGATKTTSTTTFTGIKDSAGGYKATLWSMADFGDWALATNGLDAAQICKNTTWAALSGTTFTWAQIFRKYGPYLLAINTSNGARLVEWCHASDVELWTPAADNSAGNLPLSDLSSDPVAAEHLNNFLAIYAEDQMIRFVYRPNAFVFGTDGVPIRGIGAVSKASVVPAGPVHYGIMPQGIFKTDGLTMSWVDYPSLGTWLIRNVNWDQRAKIIGWHNAERKQVRWAVPLVGSLDNNYEICYNYVTGAITFGTLPVTSAAIGQDVFSYPILGGYNGSLFFSNNVFSDNGNAVTRTLQTKPMDFGARTEWKYTDVVQTEMDVISGNGPTVELGWQERLSDPITWSTPEVVETGQFQNFIRVSGVFISLRYRSQGVNDNWNLSGFKIFGTRDGGTI